ncbi:MAG TPA: hypothetical protein VK642_04720 [Burkholderiales bacterium]|nr:hypothetical protein [Burkholderiales bacterium]
MQTLENPKEKNCLKSNTYENASGAHFVIVLAHTLTQKNTLLQSTAYPVIPRMREEQH